MFLEVTSSSKLLILSLSRPFKSGSQQLFLINASNHADVLSGLPLKWHVLQFIFNLLSDVVRAAAPVTCEVGSRGLQSWAGGLDPQLDPCAPPRPRSEIDLQHRGRRDGDAGKRRLMQSPRTPWKGHLLCGAALGQASGGPGGPSVERQCPPAPTPRHSRPSLLSSPTGSRLRGKGLWELRPQASHL